MTTVKTEKKIHIINNLFKLFILLRHAIFSTEILDGTANRLFTNVEVEAES